MDLAKAHVKALNHLSKSAGINIFNLGTGKGFSVMELINTLVPSQRWSICNTFFSCAFNAGHWDYFARYIYEGIIGKVNN